MATMTKEPKLSGGPLDLDPQIAVAFLAQIELLAVAGTDPKAFEAAQKRRTLAFKSLDKTQRENVLTICSTLARLAQA